MDYLSNWKVLLNDAGREYRGQNAKRIAERDVAQIVMKFEDMTAGQVVRELRKQGIINYRMEKDD
jgi:hypothetical protein